jgi:hypothetical protein
MAQARQAIAEDRLSAFLCERRRQWDKASGTSDCKNDETRMTDDE